MGLMGNVNPGGFEQAQVVDAAVLEEAAILDGEDAFTRTLGMS